MAATLLASGPDHRTARPGLASEKDVVSLSLAAIDAPMPVWSLMTRP